MFVELKYHHSVLPPMIETTVENVEIGSPPTIGPDTPVNEAAQHLRRPEVSALPVLEDDAVVGIVTGSDVVALVAETDERPPVHAIMSTPVTTVSPTATLDAAAETMRANGVRHLPVLSDGVYLGLLSAQTLEPYLSRRKLEIEWQGEPAHVDPDESRELTTGD